MENTIYQSAVAHFGERNQLEMMQEEATKPASCQTAVVRSTVKIDFQKLIGMKYSIELKMAVLDWMLKTGKGFDHQYGWNRDGINKSLFDYSGNNYDSICSLHSIDKLHWYFDAVFSRAVYGPENKPLKEWREKENIYPNKYRMLAFNNEVPLVKKQPYISWLISDIQNLKGKTLKKEYHHPDYKDRTEPMILGISIHTLGNGWVVKYVFSFKEFDYDPGWEKSYCQTEYESIWQFLERAYNKLSNLIADT